MQETPYYEYIIYMYYKKLEVMKYFTMLVTCPEYKLFYSFANREAKSHKTSIK